MDPVARRYAEALFLAAKGADAVDAVAGDLEAIHGAVTDATVAAALQDPTVPPSARSAVVAKLSDGRHQLTGNFLKLLLSRDRTASLDGVWPAFRAELLASRGESDGVAESATPLDQAEQDRLATLAEQLTGHKVHLSVKVDPALLSGIRLRVGNTLYDASGRTALEQLEKNLLSVPLGS